MRKTIRWVASALAFLAVGLVVFGCLNNVLRKKVGGTADMIHSFYEEKKDSLDVIVLGSSHGYSSIQSNILWGEYGIPSYVMCSPRQTVASSYYLLKDILNYQKPKVILYETYYLRYSGKYVEDASLRQAADGMRMGKAKIEMVEDLLADIPWKEKLSYYLPFLMYHSRWNELVDYDFNKELFLKGGILDYTRVEMENPGIPEEPYPLPDTTVEYLEKMISLCEENGIELIFYASPFGVDYDTIGDNGYALIQRENLEFEKFCEERGLKFYFYQKTGEVQIDFSTDFRDPTHLNTYGVTKISRHMGEVLTEQYGLKDRRGEQGYESWDRDYETYMQKSQELEEKSKQG